MPSSSSCDGSGSVKMPYWFWPASQEPTRAGNGDVVVELDVLVRIDAVHAQRLFEEQERRAARAEAEDVLALEHVPVELVDLLAAHQHEAVGRGQAAEDADLGRGVAVEHVDRGLRSDQRDVGGIGKQRRRRLVAAERGRHRDVEAGVLEVALADGDVGRRVEDRAHHLVVADLHQRLALATRHERRGDGQRAGGETALDDTTTIEHGEPSFARERHEPLCNFNAG